MRSGSPCVQGRDRAHKHTQTEPPSLLVMPLLIPRNYVNMQIGKMSEFLFLEMVRKQQIYIYIYMSFSARHINSRERVRSMYGRNKNRCPRCVATIVQRRVRPMRIGLVFQLVSFIAVSADERRIDINMCFFGFSRRSLYQNAANEMQRKK